MNFASVSFNGDVFSFVNLKIRISCGSKSTETVSPYEYFLSSGFSVYGKTVTHVIFSAPSTTPIILSRTNEKLCFLLAGFRTETIPFAFSHAE